MAKVLIRPATALDAPTIVELVKKLAAYENQPVDRVRLTEKAVIRDGFSGSPRFEVLLAELDRKIAGFALFFFNYSTWEGQPGIYVEDLYVEEPARKLGVGRKLMASVARIAREQPDNAIGTGLESGARILFSTRIRADQRVAAVRARRRSNRNSVRRWLTAFRVPSGHRPTTLSRMREGRGDSPQRHLPARRIC
jgi:GNAT superfamily N-acetyltransferase